MTGKVDNSIKELSESTAKADVYIGYLLKSIGQIKKTLLTDYLCRRIEASNSKEHFKPLFLIRDFFNNKYGAKDSSRRYAKLLSDRGIQKGAKRVGTASHVGFFFVFVEESEKDRYDVLLNEYLNR